MKADKMTEQFDKMAYLKNYAQQDKRLQNKITMTELVANNQGINFERLMHIGKGVREIHVVKIFGQEIPIRALSIREERLCRHNTYNYIKQYPEFIPGTMDYAAQFDRAFFRKAISLATSSCPEYTKDCYFTEDDLDELPPATFAYLVNQYLQTDCPPLPYGIANILNPFQPL